MDARTAPPLDSETSAAPATASTCPPRIADKGFLNIKDAEEPCAWPSRFVGTAGKDLACEEKGDFYNHLVLGPLDIHVGDCLYTVPYPEEDGEALDIVMALAFQDAGAKAKPDQRYWVRVQWFWRPKQIDRDG